MFVEIQPPKPKPHGSGVKAGLAKRGENPARLTVSIQPRVLTKFGANSKSRFRVLIGDGPNRGSIRIIPDDAGSFEARRARGGTAMFSLGHLDFLPDEPRGSAWCQWAEEDQGGITITLPSWAFAAGKRPARRTDPEAKRLTTPGRAEGGADVTGSMMGDPAPGRSALAQR